MFKKTVITLIAAAAALGLATSAQALSFNKISQVYFFGDSLTDSGFNDIWTAPAPRPDGKAPTFTTWGGYTWAQYIARDIKGFTLPVYHVSNTPPSPSDLITNNSIYAGTPIPFFVSGTKTGIDYAAGGSTTNSTGFVETWAPSLVQQVNQYLKTSGNKTDPNAVYFIWSGANDLISLLAGTTTPTTQQLFQASYNAANVIGQEAAALSKRGAKRIVVMSLPNIGLTPLIGQIAITTKNPGLPAAIKNLSFVFNSMLNAKLGQLSVQYGTKFLYVDVYDLFDNIILATQAGQPYVVAGQSFSFVNYSGIACSTVPTSIYCPSTAPSNYVFADVLHPTDEAHRLLSLRVETLIQNWS